ncbi:hypothetical protein A2V82_03755 [candidate division KSB1 bacterium RBG_16_48_16]|nr:MAG: hypothetical protein A2V82_03755 [candidate division KSB1 bacterium RBG_16_48_16]
MKILLIYSALLSLWLGEANYSAHETHETNKMNNNKEYLITVFMRQSKNDRMTGFKRIDRINSS